MDTPEDISKACVSCGARISGPYCSQCGEELITPERRTVGHFFRETVVSELVNLDSRIWRSLGLLLFRPGFLACEYAVGRRRPYINPLRLLITAIIVYTLSMLVGGTANYAININNVVFSVVPLRFTEERLLVDTLDVVDRLGVIEEQLIQKTGVPAFAVPDATRIRFHNMLRNFVTGLTLTVVLLFGLTLYALFHRRRPLYVEHMVFGMHYLSFLLLNTVIVGLVLKTGIVRGVVYSLFVLAAVLWTMAYLSIALRRFYWENARGVLPWLAAILTMLGIYALNLVFMTWVQFVSGLIAVWLL